MAKDKKTKTTDNASPGFSGTTHSDAAHWRETNIPNQKNNQMFNPHANGNSFWHYNGY
jgi:hypothetical protein